MKRKTKKNNFVENLLQGFAVFLIISGISFGIYTLFKHNSFYGLIVGFCGSILGMGLYIFQKKYQ